MDIASYERNFSPLLNLWRRSITATHHFLPTEDIKFYESVLINRLPHLETWAAQSEQGLLGFMALDKKMVAMLFVDPQYMRQGTGKALLDNARAIKGTLSVYVNEQNPIALNFYSKYGFHESKRFSVDGSGRPYPLILMKLPADKITLP